MKVEVVPHRPNWQDKFKLEAENIKVALGRNIVEIHHIGSTAIPDIYAKPIIDFLVEVEDILTVDDRNESMENLGYEVKGEFGIKGRRYFRKDDSSGKRQYQIHTFEQGSEEVRRHLAFRDYLVSHKEKAKEYSDLKCRLAEKYPYNSKAYMDGKDDFIKKIELLALAWKKQDQRE